MGLNPLFQYDALTFTLADNADLDYVAYDYLSVIITSGDGLEIAPRGAASFGLFVNREVIGDGDAQLGVVRLRNRSGAPIVGTLITSSRKIVWGDKISIDSTLPVNMAISNVDRVANDADAEAVKTGSVLAAKSYLVGFNGTAWDRLRAEGNNADADPVKTAGVLATESYGMCFNGTTWDRIRGDATGGIYVQGKVNDGSAHGTHKPVLIGGTDGTNAQTIATDGSGYVKIIVGTGTLAVSGTVTATSSGDYTSVGKAAHDAAISGNPVRQGGRALTASYAAVATGDTADFIATLDGKQVVVPYAIPENHISSMITVVNNADNAIFAAAGAGIKNHLTHLTLQNTNGTAPGLVKVRDGTTDRWQVNLPASMTTPITFHFPTALQVTANTALNILAATTGANILVSAAGYKGT